MQRNVWVISEFTEGTLWTFYSYNKILEFISLEVPQSLVTQEVTLSRLVELLLFVLNRSTTGHDAKALDSLMLLENSRKFLNEIVN